MMFFFFSSRRRHTMWPRDWSSDVCSSDLDDFGAGYSNFDRIWRLRPDIVKIDREMTRRVTVEPLARRMFTGIISVLHEAGALVCVEGIETEAEALCAIDANADLIQ